jgi:hypothetical protein
MSSHKTTGIEVLRSAVRIFNGCEENWVENYSAAELLLIWEAVNACGWVISPDKWPDSAIREALRPAKSYACPGDRIEKIDAILANWHEEQGCTR